MRHVTLSEKGEKNRLGTLGPEKGRKKKKDREGETRSVYNLGQAM